MQPAGGPGNKNSLQFERKTVNGVLLFTMGYVQLALLV